jgi:D-aminoacyl-tRNA deacylase
METLFPTYSHLHLEGQHMILIVASKKDVASLNIQKRILGSYPFKEKQETFQSNPIYETNIDDKKIQLITLNDESVYAQDLPNFFINLELIVFISRHSSVSGTPTLSAHTPGNLAEAELGGLPRRVSVSPANAVRAALKIMMQFKERMKLDYEVCYEGTHHGPSLDVPAMFAELGSSAHQWSDVNAAEAVAHAAMEAAMQFGNRKSKAVLGIGGPHYNSKFTRMALDGEFAFGHMIPKYAVSKVDLDILKQCIARTMEKVETIILDWKGIKGEDKQPLIDVLRKIDIPFEKV